MTDEIKEKAIQLADRAGFSHRAFFPAAGIRVLEEVRQMCAADRCRMYGRSWSCPPACATLEEAGKRLSGYGWGILLQTTGYLEDPFDYESMQETEKKHKAMLLSFADGMALCGDHLLLGSGACSLCGECTYPHSPCRMPERMIPSMEAYGIMVADVCALAGMEYHYGELSVTYTGCALFR